MNASNIVEKAARRVFRRLFKRQAMAVCYREENGRLELLLVSKKSSRDSFTFPKGTIEPGEVAADAARREAFEEAGVTGSEKVARLGSFYYCKKKRLPLIRVEVFQMRVDVLASDFPEAQMRQRKWLTPAEAKSCVRRRVWEIVASGKRGYKN
jgi:8-oxo-dGTP pyrophosphatase MutT (NUDIX family)